MGGPTSHQRPDTAAATRLALAQSVEQTLEIMCFAEALPTDAPPPCDAELVTARVEVHGEVWDDANATAKHNHNHADECGCCWRGIGSSFGFNATFCLRACIST